MCDRKKRGAGGVRLCGCVIMCECACACQQPLITWKASLLTAAAVEVSTQRWQMASDGGVYAGNDVEEEGKLYGQTL